MNLNKIINPPLKKTTADKLNWDANRLMAIFLIMGLSMGAVLNFIVEYIYKAKDLYSVLVFSFSMIFIGLMARWIVSLKLNEKITTHLLGLICFVTIPFIILKFEAIGGGSIWPVCFVFITGTLIFTNRTLFLYTSLSAFLTQFLLWVQVPEITIVLNASSYITRIGLVVIIICIGFVVNKIYINKLAENRIYINTIEQLAYYDHLTGLPNRLLLANQLDQAICQARTQGTLLAVLFLDLDAFKIINDTMGHEVGDQLLIEISNQLLDKLYISDTVCRYGGDEFIILINHLHNAGDIHRIAEKILEVFGEPFILNEHASYITASLGVALFPNDGDNIDLLIKNADMAMYKAKARGRNQYEICTPLMKKTMAENAEIFNNLYHALEHDELLLYYQPQISCQTGKIIGVEALLRWNHPELGLITPERFVPIAERTGLINPIGDWVLRKACEQNKRWQDAGLPHIRMALNLSIQQLYNPWIVLQVSGALKEIELDPKYLELEVTETIAIQDTEYTVEVLKSFQRLGITISIDDFGTEYSSLKYLKHLPVDRIKIAIPFIQGIGVSDKDEAITIAIINLASSMGLNIIAEGVENQDQLDFLTTHKCDEIQGFYYYKPMPAHEFETLLKTMTMFPSAAENF